MDMLAKKTETGALTLADYEARIRVYNEQTMGGYIGVGRTLIEAKEAGVVPHGEWEDWVQRVAGYSPRQAQRLMDLARNVHEGSNLARLDMSKALMLLGSGLDEDEQEAIAEKAAAEGTTVKALKEELRKAKLQIVQETGAAAEIREELKKIRSERESMEHQLKATIEAYQKRMDEECGNAYRRGLEDQATGLEKEIRKEFQDKIDHINSERARLEDARKDLLARLEEEKKGGSARWDEGFEAGRKEAVGLRNELNGKNQYVQELRKNQEDLLAAAADAEKRAADAEAELEALKAGGAGQPDPIWKTLKLATDRFMMDCETMPLDLAVLISDRDQRRIRANVNLIGSWVDMMRKALDAAVPAEGAVE